MAKLPILLFDDSCGVCHWMVQFVLRHDRARRFVFAPLGAAAEKRLLQEYHVDPAIDSVVVFDNGESYLRRAAILQVLRRLGGGWRFGLACTRPRLEETDRWLSSGAIPSRN